MLDGVANSGNDAPLGDRLELFLDALVRAGLSIGPRDRINAGALVADLVARGEVTAFGDLRPWLAPVLARSPGDRERFFLVFDVFAPRPVEPGPQPIQRIEEERTARSRVWPLLAVAVLIVGGGLTCRFWPPPVKPTKAIERPVPAPVPAPVPTPIQATAPPVSAFDVLNRVADAAERFEFAPTLEELGREIVRLGSLEALASMKQGENRTEAEPEKPELNKANLSAIGITELKKQRYARWGAAPKINWSAASHTIRLSELSGLPRNVPLALYGVDGMDGRVWAMVALALERIERPGREPTFAELLTAANETLSKAAPRPVYHLATRLPTLVPNPAPAEKAALIRAIQEAEFRARAGSDAKPIPGDLIDEHMVQRALAIADPKLRRWFADAPWMPRFAPSGAPAWAAYAAMALPLLLAMLWFANSLAIRKAYLRRRPPELPPLHLDLVSRAASQVRYSSGLFQRIAQKLRLRTSLQIERLDIDASIAATIAGGGEIPTPVYETVRQSPEYLVLIERLSAADQDAERLRALVRRLEGPVQLTVFTYRSDPARLEPEAGGRSVAIETLQASYPQHRLLILGSGAEFLDPGTLKPHAAVAKLAFWPQRALLTPLPIAEWGREEFALATELKMPIGRATPDGMLSLAELLGLEGAETDTLLDTRGDDRARPLPDVFRLRPQRYLYATPPSDHPVPQIVQDLRNMLDAPGFEWLCALAVYPAIQWDLTLYLGVTLPARTGGDVQRLPLYSEQRIAALTQLPWLKEGTMPNWLRSALIAELQPARAGEVRTALKRLIDQAQLSGDAPRDDALKLRIGKEPSRDAVAPQDLLEDEVLLDFLARGRVEDFALPNASWLERFLPRGWLNRFGIPELAAGGVALAYAGAAYALTPKPADGALVTGAWLPLVALAVGAAIVQAASQPRATYGVVRSSLIKLAPFASGLVLAMLTGLVLSKLVDVGSHVFLTTAFLAAVVVATRPFMMAWLGSPKRTVSANVVSWFWVFLIHALELALAAFILTDFFLFADWSAYPNVLFLPLALSLFALLALFSSRYLPARLPPPRALPRGTGANWPAGALWTTFALVPILLATYLAALVAGASVKLPDMPGGATVITELPDGALAAIGGADGRIRLIDLKRRTAAAVEPIDTGGAAVADLALRADRDDDPSGGIALAASTADGRILLFDAETGKPRALPPAFAGVASTGSKVHVALGPGAALVAALETPEGEPQFVAANGTKPITGSGPVTAITAAGTDRLVLATLDGQVRLARTSPYGVALVEADGEPVKLPGRARQLEFDAAKSTLTALGDDGTVLTLAIADGKLRFGKPPQKLANLSLGEVVPWNAPAQATPKADDEQHKAWKAQLERARALDKAIAQSETLPEGGFAYYPPGDIAHPETGAGRVGDRKVYLPDISYPIKMAEGQHAVMNSQIWGVGGGGLDGTGATGGSECDKRNYDPMQMRDIYCEAGPSAMPLCPAGKGRQGQSIRPPKCQDNIWDVVSVADAVVTQVTANTTIQIKGTDGTEFTYLHMHPDSIKVAVGDRVKQGDVLGRIGNFMNGGRETTHHLHFLAKQPVRIGDRVERLYIPVYASLVAAYRRAKGHRSGIDENGNLAIDPAFEIGAAKPATAPFSGEQPKQSATPISAADTPVLDTKKSVDVALADKRIDVTPTKASPTVSLPGAAGVTSDTMLGSQYVSFGTDRDVIRVAPEIGKFDRIRLRILDNDVFINSLKVVYADGSADDLAVNADIKKDTRTQRFDAKADRFIREVQLSYQSKPNFKGQARVELLGEFAEGWLGPNGEGRRFNQGWVLLGAQTVGFIGFDKDVILVGRNEGQFSKIRATVKDRAVTLNELRVVYGSGDDDVIPIKAKIEAGSTYGPIDLRGGSRAIREVRILVRSRFTDKDASGKGMAAMEIWGQHSSAPTPPDAAKK